MAQIFWGTIRACPLWKGSMADVLEIRHSPRVSKFRQSMSNCLSIGRDPKNLGMLGPHPYGWWRLPPRNTLLPHVTEFCCSMSNCLGGGRGAQKSGKLGSCPLGMGRGSYPCNTLLPHVLSDDMSNYRPVSNLSCM